MCSEKKANLAKFLVKLCYNPKIVFENETIQGQKLKEPMVIICNHSRKVHKFRVAEADGPMIRYAFLNENVCSLVAKDIIEKPVMNLLMRNLDCIPVDRFSATTGWVRDCVNEMKNGKSVVVFPEGTTLKTKEIAEFKSGFLLLAKSANVKILPVAIYRSFGLFRKRPIIKIGTPHSLGDERLTKTIRKQKTEKFQTIVTRMYCEIAEKSVKDATKEHILQYKKFDSVQ